MPTFADLAHALNRSPVYLRGRSSPRLRTPSRPAIPKRVRDALATPAALGHRAGLLAHEMSGARRLEWRGKPPVPAVHASPVRNAVAPAGRDSARHQTRSRGICAGRYSRDSGRIPALPPSSPRAPTWTALEALAPNPQKAKPHRRKPKSGDGIHETHERHERRRPLDDGWPHPTGEPRPQSNTVSRK